MRLQRQAIDSGPYLRLGRIERPVVSRLRVLILALIMLLWASCRGHCIADVVVAPAGPAAANTAQRSITQVFCPSPGDPIYTIGPRTFTPYRCRSATDCSLRLISSPPAPLDWNQPQSAPDSAWLSGSPAWWDIWEQLGWQPQSLGCGQPIGLQDAGGRAMGTNGATQLYRRLIELVPPQPNMRIRSALLDMWSDNKSAWWWQGELIASNQQGYVGQVNLAPDRIAPVGGSYVLAIQNSNDFVCAESDYCNPQGTTFRLTVTWAPGRTFAYLPLIVKPCRYSIAVAENFSDVHAFTSSHPEHLWINAQLSRAELTIRRYETRYLWRSIPELRGTDLRLTVTGSITASGNNCGLAIALRHGEPVLVRATVSSESRIISPSNPGVLIGFSYCGADCGNSLQNHLHAEWIGVDGQWAGTHEGCRCEGTPGSVIAIDQGKRYAAILDFRPSLGTASFTVRDESGSLIGRLQFPVSVSTSETSLLDTLILGSSLFRAGGEACSGWVDSVEVVSIECGP